MIFSGFHVVSVFCDFQTSWWSLEQVSMILMISMVPRAGRTPGTLANAQCFHPFLRISPRADDFPEFHDLRDPDQDSDDFLWISRNFWFLRFSDILVVPVTDFHDFDDFDGPAGRPNPRDPLRCAVFLLIPEEQLSR